MLLRSRPATTQQPIHDEQADRYQYWGDDEEERDIKKYLLRQCQRRIPANEFP